MRICKSAFLQKYPNYQNKDISVTVEQSEIRLSIPLYSELDCTLGLSYSLLDTSGLLYGANLSYRDFILEYTQTNLKIYSSLIARKR